MTAVVDRGGACRTVLESVGVYLPPAVESTDAVLRGCASRIFFPIASVTGIERRHAARGEFSIDLARKAIERCFAVSRRAPHEIDLLICCNISRMDGPNHAVAFEPSTALKLRKEFGLRAATFDISNGCAGMFTAIHLADALLCTGAIGRAMIVSGEYITHLTRAAQLEIATGLDPLEVRKRNLYGGEGREITPYHQQVEDMIAGEVIDDFE